MSRYNLPRMFTVNDEKGNPQGFGPGECEVPQWAVKKLKERGRDIEEYRMKNAPESKPADTKPADTKAAQS